MKKIFAILLAVSLLATSVFAEGYFINKVGGSGDADGTEFGQDLFSIDNSGQPDFHFAEVAEFSYTWSIAEIYALLATNSSVFTNPTENIYAAIYGVFTPVSFFSIAAGNDMRDRFSFSGGELYTENEAFLLQANPFASGIGVVYNQEFGNFGVLATASLAAAKGFFLNVGAEVRYETDDLYLALQGVGQNVLNVNEYYHYGVFGAFSMSDFDVTLGYISNYNDANANDFDFEEVGAQSYLPLPSTHVVKASFRYSNDNFMVSADVLSGLNKQYILNPESKQLRAAWDAWTDAGFDPVTQGLAENVGELGLNENIPWKVAVKGGWFVNEDVSLYLKYSIGRGNDFVHSVYFYTDWLVGEKSMVRFGANASVEGSDFVVRIPIMWKYMLDIK